jgi:hypothetical protein
MSTVQINAAILAVCPIAGVAKLHDGTYRIDHLAGTTLEQRAAAQAVVDAWPVHEARYAAVLRINAGYDAAIRAGITPQGSAITLAAEETDQNAFTRQAAWLREAQDLEVITPATEQKIVDVSGQEHTMTVAQLRILLVGYGAALKALFDLRAAKRTAAMAAQSVEEANAVNW